MSRPRVFPGLYAAGLVALCAGCVIPIGPQFQDPIAAQNFDPEITTTIPPSGSKVPGTAEGAMFEITVKDPNVGDPLYLRWAVDYPPSDAANSHQIGGDITISPSGTEERPPQTATVSCRLGLRLDQALHTVWVGVADQPFSKTALDIGLLEDNTPVTQTRTWLLELQCMVPP